LKKDKKKIETICFTFLKIQLEIRLPCLSSEKRVKAARKLSGLAEKSTMVRGCENRKAACFSTKALK
jgi:hypothetical protein